MGATIFLTLKTLPLELQGYLETQGKVYLGNPIKIIFSVVNAVIGLVAVVGLYRFKEWSRHLYIACYLVNLVSVLNQPAVVMNVWVSLFGTLLNIHGGMVLALIYFSPVKDFYRPTMPTNDELI